MTTELQRHFFDEDLTIPERFDLWKQSPGGAQIMRRLYEVAAGCYRDWQRFGIRTSQRFIWEQVRRRLDKVQGRLARSGNRLDRERGFCMNDHFTKSWALHAIAGHPEWSVMFSFRDGVKPVYEQTVIVRRQRVRPACLVTQERELVAA